MKRNFFRKLFTGFTVPSLQLSLHWGSHHSLPAFSRNLLEVVVDKSPMQSYQSLDPIINSYIYRHSFSDRIVARIANAHFDVLSGAIYVDNTLILESLNRNRKIAEVSLYKCNFRADSLIVVPKDTHYHWLIEILPRIFRAADYSPTSVLVASTTLSSVQKQSLEMLNMEVHYCDKRHHPFEIVLATFGSQSGWPHPNDVLTLRNKLSIPELPGTLPIFISRSKSRRSDSSTLKLDSWAISHDLKLVRCENLSWKDQIELFKSASSITGEHGAGLANLIFAPKGTILEEIYKDEYANPVFQNLSKVINESDESRYKSYKIAEILNDIV